MGISRCPNTFDKPLRLKDILELRKQYSRSNSRRQVWFDTRENSIFAINILQADYPDYVAHEFDTLHFFYHKKASRSLLSQRPADHQPPGKPGSVHPGGDVFIIYPGPPLPTASNYLPLPLPARYRNEDNAWYFNPRGLPNRTLPPRRVRSYRTISPLPARSRTGWAVSFLWHFP